MKFAKQRFTRMAGEKMRLLGMEELLVASGALLNLMVLAGTVYLSARWITRLGWSGETLFLLFLTALVAVNFFQFIAMSILNRRSLQMEKRLVCDPLTGAFNRMSFEEMLEEEVRRAARYHYALTLCLLDLDEFRSFNNHFGSHKGDKLLRNFVDFLSGTIRFTDSVARYGADEFCLILPHTEAVHAEKLLARLLAETEKRLGTSFSAGLTSYHGGESRTQFLMRTQLALVQARRDGKKSIRCLVAGEGGPAVVSL